MKMIKLSQIDHTVRFNELMKQTIAEQLGHPLLLDHRPLVLVFHALGVFNFRKGKYNLADERSLEKAAAEILSRSGIYEEGRIVDIFRRKNDSLEYDPINHFIVHIIGFHELPFLKLKELDRKVKMDLSKLQDLIDEYEKDPVIMQYLTTGQTRNEHESKVRLDFYKRCLTERAHIIKYITNGIDARAITKARQDPEFSKFGIFWTEEYYDKPYHFWAFSTMEYFDHRKIDPVQHRLLEVSIPEAKKYKALYHKNKSAFYRKLKETTSPNQVFHGMLTFYIKMIPKIEEREPILKELKSLFQTSKWYGFTALALTQVEGLFSDMIAITDTKKAASSLPTKVNALRPHYQSDGGSLDYFEYSLPRYRNRFLHYGQIKGENFKLLAYDLLYDLHYLMMAFHLIKDPHIQLHQLLKKNNLDFIIGLPSITDLFLMVKAIKNRLTSKPTDTELQKVLDVWVDFEKNILAPSLHIEYFLDISNLELESKIKAFYDQLAIHSPLNEQGLDLENMSLSEFDKRKNEILNCVSQALLTDYDSYAYIIKCYQFTKWFKHYLSTPSERVKTLVATIVARYKNHFVKLEGINTALFPPSGG